MNKIYLSSTFFINNKSKMPIFKNFIQIFAKKMVNSNEFKKFLLTN